MDESNVTAVLNPETDYHMSPEMVEITTTYLQCASIGETAAALNIPKEKVSYYLNKPEARRFIDTIFLEQGYINRHKIQNVLDEIIEMKLEEMRESEIGSNKDIMDILAFAHKMGEDVRKGIRETEKVVAPTNQFNTQINADFGENYTSLMSKLIK
jgi:hypothetical protein